MRRGLFVAGGVVLLGVLTAAAAGAGTTRQVVEIQMKEFAFVPSTVTLRAGVPAEVRLVNRSVVEHEFMVYDLGHLHLTGMDPEKMHRELEARSYFRGLPVQVEGKAKMVERRGKDLAMVTLAPGERVTLRFTPRKRGTFEMGCHIPGHYEAGMKGSWVVR
ncbi:MAG: cupredoxin domain-containing protein [Armatimonadota bacterium]|nr:cupredoxin domain-containing protein [Armatimonadota bacterium]MDR7443956.1 cupredoxin domain-containing protein [Armatimonadota bacterium]MDR7570054.1 cupredoxin domain-containing protein [Armatimonadota bacterium]MDR7615441.1 cupredoxin domain-containing protein [Armatimonadota bacterium]